MDKSQKGLFAPKGWYDEWQVTIDSWESLHERIENLHNLNSDRKFVWRGLENSEFSLVSTLYRNLTDYSATNPRTPSEDEMSAAESRILMAASSTWRLGKFNGLELFAKLQHMGAPTRLIDITMSPFVAVWFACQDSIEFKEKDGRLFAFCFNPDDGVLDAEETYAERLPFWLKPENTKISWGKGEKVRLWFPANENHPRIFAQNAGFIYDGVPVMAPGANTTYTKTPLNNGRARVNWKIEDLRQASSLHVNFVHPETKARVRAKKTAVYTFLISATAKKEILTNLEIKYGITASSLFPGVDGLAHSLAKTDYSMLELDIPNTQFSNARKSIGVNKNKKTNQKS